MWPVLSQQLYLVPVCRKERREVTATAVRSQSCKTSEAELLTSQMHPPGSQHGKGNLAAEQRPGKLRNAAQRGKR